MDRPWYQRGYRRVLMDMHVPDWDERFLSRYDPRKMIRLYEQAGVTSVLTYCQSHVGLCFWPTKTGKMHAGLRGRDVVGEMLDLLHARGLAACGYYSLIYNNRAFLEHPDWRIVPASDRGGGGAAAFAGSRYGLVCPNHDGYRDFALRQIEEILGAYAFDGMFYDMTFWPQICLCESCRGRYRREEDAEIPATIDWCSIDWCRFQAARQRWIAEFAQVVTNKTKAVRPGTSVYHNCATLLFNWTLGQTVEGMGACDFLGGDFYKDPLDDLTVCKVLDNLTAHRPIEFATSRCVDLTDHERTKSQSQMEQAALECALFGGALLFIDAVNPDGTANPGVYRRIGRAYQRTAPYEEHLGGQAVEDVGIYFSTDAKVDFRENGAPLHQAPMWDRDYPHLRAVRGWCGLLQRAHVPFGVTNRLRLGELSRYRAVILPNVMRMDAEEVEAFRQYVRQGGALYASRYTSLVETRGTRHEDFLLADVFGCHLAGQDAGPVSYLKPADPAAARAIQPQQYLSLLARPGADGEKCGMLRLAEGPAGQVLATLSLPYSDLPGSVLDQNWASIHSSPPWRDTAAPTIVLNRFGLGRAVYCAADIECIDGPANEGLLRYLLGLLVDGPPSFSCQAHPAVWTAVHQQADRQRLTVGFLNNPPLLPPVAMAPIPFTLRPPPGRRFVRLRRLPDGKELPFRLADDGTLLAKTPRLKLFELLAAEYE